MLKELNTQIDNLKSKLLFINIIDEYLPTVKSLNDDETKYIQV